MEALNEREREREMQLSKNPEALEKFLEDRRTGKAAGMPLAPGQVVLGINKNITPELYELGGRGPVGAYYLWAKHGVRWADD